MTPVALRSLWLLAASARSAARELRPLIAVFFVAFVANAIVVWKYFVVVPLVMAVAIAICLALAFVSAGWSEPARSG